MLLGALGLTAHAVATERRTYAAAAHAYNKAFTYDAFSMGSHANPAVGVASQLFPHEKSPEWERPPTEVLEKYADAVDFGDGVNCTGPAIAEWLAEFAADNRDRRRAAEFAGGLYFNEEWKDQRFRYNRLLFDCADPPGQPSTGALTILVLKGNILLGVGAEITDQRLVSLPLWTVERRTLSQDEASAWATSFLAALLPEAGPSGAEILSHHFYPHLLQFASEIEPVQATPSQSLIDSLRASCAAGARPRLARPPAPATAAPGARQRLVLDIDDRGQASTWTVDLIFTDDRWQCVRLKFEAAR